MSNKVYKLSVYNRYFWIVPVWVIGFIIFGFSVFGVRHGEAWPTIIIAVIGAVLFIIITLEMDSRIKKEMQQRIDKGDLNAQLELGVFLTSAGNNVKEFEEAKNWLEKAVALNLEDAQSKLDECEKKLSEAREREAEKRAKEAEKAAKERYSSSSSYGSSSSSRLSIEDGANVIAALYRAGESCNTCSNNNNDLYCPYEDHRGSHPKPNVHGVQICHKHSNAWNYR